MKIKTNIYPNLLTEFLKWLTKYSTINGKMNRENSRKNKILYDIDNRNSYTQAVIDYIAGMSDNFALTAFNELTTLTAFEEVTQISDAAFTSTVELT